VTSLTFYGGVDEIGGNQILLESEGTRIFLDFGRRFGLEGDYFDYPFMQPFFVPDLINIGAVPPLRELYRGYGAKSAIDGVLLSHPHLDHCGHLSLLAPGTEVHLGKPTKELLDVRLETWHKAWDRRFDHLSFTTFRTGDEVRVKAMEFRPVHVDHSIPASYAFLIHTGGKAIAYTGDLRMHGYQRDFTKDFLAELEREQIDVLICEGTNLVPEGAGEEAFFRKMEAEFIHRMGTGAPRRVTIECGTEAEVRERLTELVGDARGLVLVETSPADVDRVRTLWQVAKATGREFVLDDKQAFMVYELGERTGIPELPTARDSFLWLARRRMKAPHARHEDEEAYKKHREDWELFLIEKCESVGSPPLWGPGGRKYIREHSSEVLVCSPQAASCLAELRYDGPPFETSFVLSKSEPFTEELVLSFDKLLHWLALFGIRKYNQVHVSGHCDAAGLKEIIATASPQTLFPVHTEHPELFEGLAAGLAKGVVVPEKGKTYQIS